MAYNDLINEEGVIRNYLSIFYPRRVVSSFSLVSGSVYKASFIYSEYVSNVTQDGFSLVMASSVSLSAGQFYFDDVNKELYVRMSDSSNPSTKTVIAEYELYFGTYDAHHFRIPTDDTSKVVYYEPLIKGLPSQKFDSSGVTSGIQPVQSTSISILNPEHILEHHLYDSSFNRAKVLIYNWVGDLSADNCKLVIRGLCSDFDYDSDGCTFKIFDSTEILRDDFRPPNGDAFFDLSNFPNLDPSKIGQAIPYILGRIEGIQPTNIDYNANQPTTSDNRDWVVLSEQTGLAEKVYTVQSGSTSTVTKINTTVGLEIGDCVWLDHNVGSDHYVEILDIDRGLNTITHESVASPMSAGEFVKRGFVSRVAIIQQGIKYLAMYHRDYTISTSFNGSASGFVFNTSLESNLGMPETLSPSDVITCTVYGPTNFVTMGGPSFGSNDSIYGVLTDPIAILFQILKWSGVLESEMDLAAFTSLQLSLGSKSIGINFSDGNKFKSYRDAVISILESLLIFLYLDTDLEWSVYELGPIGVISEEIGSEEIIDKSLKYNINYNLLASEFYVEYNVKTFDENTQNETASRVSQVSNVAKWVHLITKQKTVKSLFLKEVHAQELCDRLSFIFGDRQGLMSLTVKTKLFSVRPGLGIKLNRVKLPGQVFDGDTIFEMDFLITEGTRSLRSIQVVLDDQKGIQDNQLNW